MLVEQVRQLQKVQRQLALVKARLARMEARTAKPRPRTVKRAAPVELARGSMTLAKVQF